MRLPWVLPILLIASTLFGDSAWDRFLHRHQHQDPRWARWTLAVRGSDFSGLDGLADEDLQKLLLGGDLVLEPLSPAEAKDLWKHHNWGDRPTWLLLSPAGELVASSPGRPQGQTLAETLRRAGGMPRWELRAAFLREHPEQGEALLEESLQGFRLMRARLSRLEHEGQARLADPPGAGQGPAGWTGDRIRLAPGSEGEAQAESLCAGTGQILARLLAVPGWEREMRPICGQLGLWDVSQSGTMRGLFRQAAATMAQRLRQDPYEESYAQFWMEALEASGQPPESLAGLLVPLPDRPWPPSGMVSRLLEPFRRRQDWSGALAMIERLTPSGPPEPCSRQGWNEYLRLQCALQTQRGLALASQGAWDLAGAALAEARRVGGGQGIRELLSQRGGAWSGSAGDQQAWRTLLSQAYAHPEPGPEPPARPDRLRLVVLGSPPWILAWSGLHRAPELAPWAPGELIWSAGSQHEHRTLAAAFGWGPEPRWALLCGESLRATGTSCPEPQALVSLLESEPLPILLRLRNVLRLEPEHLAGHRARYRELLKRMPDPRLEPELVASAAAARVVLGFGPEASWKPDSGLWAAAASTVLGQIEIELRSWPSRVSLWQEWISWARFHPARPSIQSLAENLPYWFPQGDWHGILPYAVHRAVAAEMHRQHRFDAMRSWFQAAWDTLDQRPLSALRIGERGWAKARRREEETAIFQPLREALRALRCTREQAELERVFREMMGQERNGR